MRRHRAIASSLLLAAAAASSACSTAETRAADGGGDGPGPAPAEATATSPPEAPSDARPEADEAAPDGMVVVPEGVFLMGGESAENTPVHEVLVGRFYLDRTEVTMRSYAACVRDGGCVAPRVDNPFCNALWPGREDHPVNCVDHHDATRFCAFVGKRLPTEPEWEYAARGGAEQRPFSWGSEPPDRSRACYMHEGGSCRVGAHPEGAFGLLDMTGNVWEWTSSWYGPFPGEAEQGFYKVYRGGSWSRRFPKWMRGDLRNRYRPEEQSASLGMRCAKDPRRLICPAESEPRGARCVRTSGTPKCPKGELFVEGKCRPGGIVPAWSGAPGGPAPVPPPAASAPGAPTTAAAAPLGRARSPGFDADCAANFPGLTVAYNFSGGTFHDREPLVRGAGCKKRDVGPSFTSACCAQ